MTLLGFEPQDFPAPDAAMEDSSSASSSLSSSWCWSGDDDSNMDAADDSGTSDEDEDDRCKVGVGLRNARDGDLDDISSIGIASFPSDPQWNYRYPYRLQYPEDHRHFARQRYEEWLTASRTPRCMIVVAVGNDERMTHRHGVTRRVLAFAIWRLPLTCPDDNDTDKVKPPMNRIRRDANYAHMKAYRDSSLQAERSYFDGRFGPQRMDLAQLVTDPGYRRRGLATRLVQYGQRIARQKNWAIGVFASPIGEVLYKKLGFEVLGMVVTKAEDDDEILEFPAMAWKAPQWRNCLIT